MELKLGSGQIPVDAHESFNRTFMELKHLESVDSVAERMSFNRTFMELKRAICGIS